MDTGFIPDTEYRAAFTGCRVFVPAWEDGQWTQYRLKTTNSRRCGLCLISVSYDLQGSVWLQLSRRIIEVISVSVDHTEFPEFWCIRNMTCDQRNTELSYLICQLVLFATIYFIIWIWSLVETSLQYHFVFCLLSFVFCLLSFVFFLCLLSLFFLSWKREHRFGWTVNQRWRCFVWKN